MKLCYVLSLQLTNQLLKYINAHVQLSESYHTRSFSTNGYYSKLQRITTIATSRLGPLTVSQSHPTIHLQYA